MSRVALLVRTPTWQGRSGRDALDMALAAAVMGFHLDVYFLGSGVHQLLDDRSPELARLPPGYRAWASLPDLTTTRFFADAKHVNRLNEQGVTWLVTVTPLSFQAMANQQTEADHVLVIS